MTLIDQIRADEGWRATVYDDATGLPITRGYTCKGNPTIGYGTLLSSPGGISDSEGEVLLQNRIATATAQAATLPVFVTLDDVRQDVLIQMVFQLGLGGVQAFTHTLAALESGDYAAAADGMRLSHWAQQTPTRARRLAKAMETGVA